MEYSHDTFLSPFTWRYGSPEMRRIWSLRYQRQIWRRIWVALAAAQQRAGLVTEEQVADLKAHQDEIDLDRAHQLEETLRHDLMAEILTYAEQCPVGGGIIHLGATSMDIEDNADALRLREALQLIRERLRNLLKALAERIDQEAGHVCMAFTHLQPAEPTTIGYRLAFYAQDLLADFEALERIIAQIRGKGFKGAVGTSASYAALLEGSGIHPREMEAHIMESLGLDCFEVASQTYPRRQDWEVLNALSGVAMTAYKFAFDLRILQSPPIGEWAEPFGKHQVGSSAMPFKRNPIQAENIDSLARFVAALPRVMWDNAAHSLLERTLDDSGNRRAVLPEAFLAVDEIISRMTRLITGLIFDDHAIRRSLANYGIFASTERLLMELVRRGANRQDMHEMIREHSFFAWGMLREGHDNPLMDRLCAEGRVTALMSVEELRSLLNAEQYIGDAPERARALAAKIREKTYS